MKHIRISFEVMDETGTVPFDTEVFISADILKVAPAVLHVFAELEARKFWERWEAKQALPSRKAGPML